MSYLKQCIEIPILVILIITGLESSVTSNFIIYRTCYVALGYNESDCALLGTNNPSEKIQKLEATVQPLASVIMMLRNIISATFPGIYCFIIGPWSNRYGRKPILIANFFGLLCTYLILTVVSLIKWSSPWWTLLASFISFFGGGYCGILAVTFCYITDITSEGSRNMKMGALELCVGFGTVIGLISSSYLLSAIGYSGVFGVCAVMMIIPLLYVYFLLNESVSVIEKKDKWRNLFKLTVIFQTIKVVAKPRQNYKRALLFLYILILVVEVLPLFGETTIIGLFFRKQFHWSFTNCTWFIAISCVADVIESGFILIVINKIWNVKDMKIIIGSFILMSAGSSVYIFATVDWHIYVGTLFKRSNLALMPLTRSAISKIVPHEELGQIFAFTTAVEMLNQLISSPLYTFIYDSTLNTFDNAFNIISIVIYIFGIIVASVIMFVRKQQNPSVESTNIKI